MEHFTTWTDIQNTVKLIIKWAVDRKLKISPLPAVFDFDTRKSVAWLSDEVNRRKKNNNNKKVR